VTGQAPDAACALQRFRIVAMGFEPSVEPGVSSASCGNDVLSPDVEALIPAIETWHSPIVESISIGT